MLEKTLGLGLKLVHRELEIDSACVGVHPLVVTAQKPPERLAKVAAPKVPEGDVDRGYGEGHRAAPPHEVHAPPHPLPQVLYSPRVRPDEYRREVAGDVRVDRPTAGPGRHGIAEPLRSLVRPDADRHELKVGDLSMGGVRQHSRKRYVIVICLDRRDLHISPPPSYVSATTWQVALYSGRGGRQSPWRRAYLYLQC